MTPFLGAFNKQMGSAGEPFAPRKDREYLQGLALGYFIDACRKIRKRNYGNCAAAAILTMRSLPV